MRTDVPARGWYSDPGNDRLQRWWDGTDWTPLVRPVRLPQTTDTDTEKASIPSVPPHRRSMSTDVKRALLITAITVATFTISGYASVFDSPSPTSSSSSSTTE